MTTEFDVVVIGAGAAGLLTATRAAERGRRVLLLEKNRKAGVKILMSGGTRCNLTQATDSRGIIDAFGEQGPFLHSPLASLSPDDLVQIFEAEGVPTKRESTGKIFPASDKATDVLNALLRRLRRSKAGLALDEAVLDFQQLNEQFQVVTSRRTITCAKAVVTTGGQSYPGCGTTGDGYEWLSRLGHTIATPRPALVPVTIRADWAKSLRGITIPDVVVGVLESVSGGNSQADPRRAALANRRGSLLFAHFGLSGPAILDVSRFVTLHPRPRSLCLLCDFLPTIKSDALTGQLLQWTKTGGKKQISGLLSELLPRRLIESLLVQAGLPADRRVAELTRQERVTVVSILKQVQFPVTGTSGFKKAEVTTGGVALDEVDSRTMQSKQVANLFLAGEILDLDGPIGGYNFQSAFSTGWLAGENV